MKQKYPTWYKVVVYGLYTTIAVMLVYLIAAFAAIRTWETQIEIYQGQHDRGMLERMQINLNKPLGYRIVTAYNAVAGQTDDTPCISANNMNVCETDIPIVATNELPLGSWVEIDGIEYLVADRTNSRYQYRYDILMDKYVDAREFGVQTKEITIVKK